MTIAHNSCSSGERLAEKTILVVEDDPGIRLLLKDILAFETRYHAVFSWTGTEAVATIKKIRPSLLILNYNLPDTNGLALYDQLHELRGLERVPALLLSAHMPVHLTYEMKRRDIIFLQKPFRVGELLQLIETLTG